MIIRFTTTTNSYGNNFQLEIDTDAKQFKYGTFLFHSADVTEMKKVQLEQLINTIEGNGFKRVE